MARKKQNFECGHWYPINTAPLRQDVLVWWPVMKLDDDDGTLTDEQVGGDRMVSTQIKKGQWEEPSYMSCRGEHFGDDREHGMGPTMWSPIPAEPQ